MHRAASSALVLVAAAAGIAVTPPLRADFVRGDATGDGRITTADAVLLVGALFGGRQPLACEDAADATDDGVLDIGDVAATLRFLFAGGAIPAPAPGAPGPDPTCDRLRCRSSPGATPAVVISEIQYNPVLSEDTEFLELQNRTAAAVDVSGWRFVEGILFTFPAGTVIPPQSLVLVVRNPESTIWRRNPATRYGPYSGGLSNDGERVTLVDGACIVESFTYDDRHPWPVGADGYGGSLERVDPVAAAGDPSTWRASTAARGTPGESNSVAGTPPLPVIAFSSVDPASPRSSETARVRVTLAGEVGDIRSVTLRWEGVASTVSEPVETPMLLEASGDGFASYAATLPPQPSQSLVRWALDVELEGGMRLHLPHTGEPAPFLSFFVHDREVEALIPVLWVFPLRNSSVAGRNGSFTAVVVSEPGAGVPLNFDGAQVRRSENGQKIRFLKGAEYRGDRTLNIIPEHGGGGTGVLAPHMEHIGFQVFRELGHIAPRADWFRVIEHGNTTAPHTQRLVIQQVNERFLALNGLDPDGDLYKLDKSSFRKQTNIETGSQSLFDLLAALRQANHDRRRQAVLDRLDLASVASYSVIGMLIENWDGFHNNMYVYHDLSPEGRWMVFPWDLDQVCEPDAFDFPLTWPLTGQPLPGASYNRAREPGPISRPFHLEADLDAAYRAAVAAHVAPGSTFTVESMEPRIAAVERLLLDDLELAERYLGAERPARRLQIVNSYAAIRQYMELRLTYLRAQLGI